MTPQKSRIYKGKIVDLVVKRVPLTDGRTAIREVVRHPGGVAVVAERRGRILFVRQHRYPLDGELLEIPAGKLDGREDPEKAAARELEEETGYRPARLRKIGAFFTTPGFCDELLHIYLAEGLKKTEQKFDSDEQIVVESYPLNEAVAMIASGEIRDAKTAVGLLWLALERSRSGTDAVSTGGNARGPAPGRRRRR
jgi:ADP-ribose pyrophosphatase